MTTHLDNQSQRTATTTHAGTNHIQLAPPNSWPPIKSNWHRQIHGYQSHPIIIVTHVGSKHIPLPSPYTSAPTKSNCYRLTRGPRTTPNCHSHKCRHKPHQPGKTKLVCTNLIQLSCHTLRDQTHPTATATHAGTNHIQLAPRDS